jgi:O-methyltransferase domain
MLTFVYPWEKLGGCIIVDVGGGVGSVSMALLRMFPQLRSLVQDRPEAVRDGQNVSLKPPFFEQPF